MGRGRPRGLGITLLVISLPNDLEVLYYALDSACAFGCDFNGYIEFSGIRNPQLENYVLLKYLNISPECTTRINIISSRVSYSFSWINYKREAEVKMIIRSCDRKVAYRYGKYSDRVPFNRTNDIRVPGISPDINTITPSYFEIGITSLMVLGILYAFYVIEGQ
ncbi:MAG: hypothetical protein ABIL88_02425 [candidate division WOR-3 bacterium]